MMRGVGACQLVGLPVRHAACFQDVANRMRHVIISRAVGSHCTRLLEEGYATKGFRIDTKSCDWGPMRGFVCVDPRLSKLGGNARGVAKNAGHTHEALAGVIRKDALGGLEMPPAQLAAAMAEWTAGCKPIVISSARFHELRNGGFLENVQYLGDGGVTGLNLHRKSGLRFPWRLIPVTQCHWASPAFRQACPDAPFDGYGIFVDRRTDFPFFQQRHWATDFITVRRYEAVLGLINPGTESYGYRACVTGDYDLFAVWPFGGQDLEQDRRFVAPLPADIAANYQNYQLGNITQRINTVKILLNSSLQSAGGYTGGMMVHHSDEVGNPTQGLRKSLVESMPLIAFMPGQVDPWGIQNTMDFKTLVLQSMNRGYYPDLRPEWRNFMI